MVHEHIMKYKGFDAAIGRVSSFKLGTEDHGIMTFWVHLDFNGSGQAFGGYCMDSFDQQSDKRCGSAFGTECVLRLLRCFNVEDIGEIKGKPCMALYDNYKPFSSKIIGLAPLPSDKGEIFIIEDAVAYCKQLENQKESKS